MIKYLLDTNTCIYTIKRKPAHIKRLFNAHIGQMAISSVTWGELIHGAEKSQRVEENLRQLEGFRARLEILEFAEPESRQFGQVMAELEKNGKTIGPYDMMVAGHARSNGLIVVTNNVGEFSRVSGIRIENWIDTQELWSAASPWSFPFSSGPTPCRALSKSVCRIALAGMSRWRA